MTAISRREWFNRAAATAGGVGVSAAWPSIVEIADSIQLPEGSPFPHGMSVWKGYVYWTDDIGGGIAPVCRVKI